MRMADRNNCPCALHWHVNRVISEFVTKTINSKVLANQHTLIWNYWLGTQNGANVINTMLLGKEQCFVYRFSPTKIGLTIKNNRKKKQPLRIHFLLFSLIVGKEKESHLLFSSRVQKVYQNTFTAQQSVHTGSCLCCQNKLCTISIQLDPRRDTHLINKQKVDSCMGGTATLPCQ